MAYGDNYGDGKLYPLEHKDAPNKCRRWQLKISVNGKQRKRNFSGTHGEARKALKAFKEESLASERDGDGLTFAEYAERWVNTRETLGTVDESTIRKNRSSIKALSPRIGDAQMTELTRSDIERMYMDLLYEGRRPNYVRELKSALSNIFNEAVRDGVCVSSPVKDARLPKKEPSRKKAMPPSQLKSVLSSLDPSNRFEIIYFMCAAVGLRRGEAMALRWPDIDFESEVIHIQSSLKSNNTIGETKTSGSDRYIPMPGFVSRALKKRRDAQMEELESFGVGGTPEFVTESLGERVPYRATAYDWECRRDRLGASGYTMHELRHSFASMMANEENCPVKVLMAILGHTDINTTLAIYVHSSRELETKAMLGIEGRFRDVCVP